MCMYIYFFFSLHRLTLSAPIASGDRVVDHDVLLDQILLPSVIKLRHLRLHPSTFSFPLPVDSNSCLLHLKSQRVRPCPCSPLCVCVLYMCVCVVVCDLVPSVSPCCILAAPTSGDGQEEAARRGNKLNHH